MVGMVNPPSFICVHTYTEVEVVACDTPEAIALHRERSGEVDLMISLIDMVERDYWGNMFV